MSDLIEKALEDSRPAIQAGLEEAERELAELDERRRQLEGLITRARAALGEHQAPPAATVGQRLTLHEAIELILDENANRWMTVHELAQAINERNLYEKRDRSAVEASQIHARANKYPARFEKDGPNIRRADI